MPQNRTTTYFDQIKFALERYHTPLALGEASPLAAPYFLGSALQDAATDASERGQVLCREIDATIEILWGATRSGESLPDDGKVMIDAAEQELAQSGRGARYDCLILELNYFKRRFTPAPRSQSEIYNDILHISRASHDRYLAAAVERLGSALLRRLRPTVRFEQPKLQSDLIGRSALLQGCIEALQAGKSVTLTGAGGMGKTSLGLAVSEEWQTPAIFWFTVRPGVNDSLHSLLFALGYFLHQQGASLLWRQLIADNGQIKDFHLASGLAQSDLRALAHRPLLCFDEIDLLRRLTLDSENPRHTQLLEFIDTLRPVAPLLLIGQQSVMESDIIFALDGLGIGEVAQWLRQHAVNFEEDDAQRLHLYTQGNPRLIELCIALHRSSEVTLRKSLDQMPQSPAVSALWQRLQRRLDVEERQLLAALSVFRSPAPLDAWGQPLPIPSPLPIPPLVREGTVAGQMEGDSSLEKNALARLLERALLRLDGQGGVYLLPAVGEVIYGDLTIETRQELHLQAAAMLSQRGEYTAAAWHFLSADAPEQAVGLWFPRREEEIQRGQASAALAIFEQISLQRLEGKCRQQAALLRAELYQLLGEPEKAEASLRQSEWPAESELAINAARVWGDALDAQGKPDAAFERYDEGVARLEALFNHGTQLYAQRGLLHLRQRSLDAAWRDAQLAQFHAERLLGAVADQRGEFETALQHYQTALKIAETTGHESGIAQINHYLGILFARQQQIDFAVGHFERAMEYYERIGDRMSREYVRGNLAAAYIDAQNFSAAAETAHKSLVFFQQIGDSFSIALSASNLAEAHVQLGNFAEAQHFAEIVLQQEDPHSHPYALFTLGTVFQKQQQWETAELYFAQSRQLAQMNQDRFLLAYAWRALGEVYIGRGERDAAAHALHEGLALFKEMAITGEIDKTEMLIDGL